MTKSWMCSCSTTRSWIKTWMPASRAAPPEDRPLNQKWSWDRILRSCFIKQADVLQGLYFLEHLYDKETIRRNFDFYEPMTVHESQPVSRASTAFWPPSLGKLGTRPQELYQPHRAPRSG